jgi:hypothetical protein
MGVEGGMAEAYADDLTLIFKWNLNTLRKILDTIKEYGELTGLVINVDKTQLMLVGKERVDVGLMDTHIFGVELVDEIKVLGIKIDNKVERLHENLELAISKMENVSRYWSQFNISLPARVMVAKTYILSQAIYYLNILELSDDIRDRMNRIIISFISKGQREIARENIILRI